MDELDGGGPIGGRDDLYRMRYHDLFSSEAGTRPAWLEGLSALKGRLQRGLRSLRLLGLKAWAYMAGHLTGSETVDWRVELAAQKKLPAYPRRLLAEWVSRHFHTPDGAAISAEVGAALHQQRGWTPTGPDRKRMIDQIVQQGWDLEMEVTTLPQPSKGQPSSRPPQAWRNRTAPERAPVSAEQLTERIRRERVLLEMLTLLRVVEPDIDVPAYLLRNVAFLPEALERENIAELLLTSRDATTMANLLTHLQGPCFRQIWERLFGREPKTAARVLSWADSGQLTDFSAGTLIEKLSSNPPGRSLLIRGVGKIADPAANIHV